MTVATAAPTESSAPNRGAGVLRLPIGLCIPVYRSFTPETVGSLMKLSMATVEVDDQSVGLFGGYRHEVGARLMDALEMFADKPELPYMLMIDGDMRFEPQDVLDLYGALQRRPEMGAIGGLYRRWAAPYGHLAHWRGPGGRWIDPEAQESRVERYKKSGEIVGVDLFGGGFIMCLTEVFEKLEKPYFRSGEDEGGRYGQDTYFCKSLKEAGYKPSIHFGVHVGHVGPRCYMP